MSMVAIVIVITLWQRYCIMLTSHLTLPPTKNMKKGREAPRNPPWNTEVCSFSVQDSLKWYLQTDSKFQTSSSHLFLSSKNRCNVCILWSTTCPTIFRSSNPGTCQCLWLWHLGSINRGGGEGLQSQNSEPSPVLCQDVFVFFVSPNHMEEFGGCFLGDEFGWNCGSPMVFPFLLL